MGYLDSTVWNDFQPQGLVNEKRFKERGVIDAVMESTKAINYLPADGLAKMSTASGARNIDFPVLQDQSVTVNTTPGFDYIPSNLPTTAQIAYTAYDVFSGFRFYPASYGNNQVAAEEARNQIMLNVADACANQIEVVLEARLGERKNQATLAGVTQASQGDGTYTWNATPDELEINKAAQKDAMFGYLESIMDANDLGGSYRILTSKGGTMVHRQEAAKYQTNNDKNLANNYYDLSRIHETSNISAGSDNFEGYFMRDGSIGAYTNHPYDFANGTTLKGGSQRWSISDVEIPFTRMRANVYVNSEATDATSILTTADSNLTMTTFEEMALWFRFYVVYPYNSDLTTRVQDIVRLSGKTS